MEMAAYLHSRLMDAAGVQRLLSDRLAEGLHLDFKQTFWTVGEEAAKDVAAFANSEGGDLVIGVSEKAPGVAGGIVPVASQGRGKDPAQRLLQWLHNHLAPEQAANTVQIQEIHLPSGDSVLAVAVPPWADGVVGVGTSNGEVWRFPYRDGADTQFWGWEEVLMRSDVQARRAYLRTMELVGYGLARVAIASPLIAIGPDGTADLAHRDLDRGSQALLSGKPTPESLMLQMRFKSSLSVVSIPWELVRAVWRDPQDNIAVALSARLILDVRAQQPFWRIDHQL